MILLIIRIGQGGRGARWNPKGPSHENRMEYEGGGGGMLFKISSKLLLSISSLGVSKSVKGKEKKGNKEAKTN